MPPRPDTVEIFLATAPGLEPTLAEEARAKGFNRPTPTPGGVLTRGTWQDAWRANLWLRGTTRVLVRIDAFRTTHLAHLAQRARETPWPAYLRPDTAFALHATCTKSRLYHSGAVAERIAAAITATTGAPQDKRAPVTIHARLDHDFCTLSIDTSGEPLHRRGLKQEVNAAPLRETLASLFLRQCGFDGTEPVLDPMCGSGTFVIEAAEIASRLNPGRARSFAFEHLATFDAEAWARMRAANRPRTPTARFHGSDRNAGAIAMSRANAERAGVAAWTDFTQAPVSEMHPPEGPPGLVIANPPYGTRLSEGRSLLPLYQALGTSIRTRFHGWRAAILATDHRLAHATGLPFQPPGPPSPPGGLRGPLSRTDPVPGATGVGAAPPETPPAEGRKALGTQGLAPRISGGPRPPAYVTGASSSHGTKRRTPPARPHAASISPSPWPCSATRIAPTTGKPNAAPPGPSTRALSPRSSSAAANASASSRPARPTGRRSAAMAARRVGLEADGTIHIRRPKPANRGRGGSRPLS